MKVSKSKCIRKKNPFKFDSIKNSFWVHKVSGIKILFPNFHKKLSSGFWKKSSLYFTSHMKYFKSKCNRTPPPPQIHLILNHSKIPFECTESLALGCYSQDFTKNYRVVLRKVHFTSAHIWKFLSPRVTTKPSKNAFNFHSAKASIWVHIDTGIRMWFTEFYKTL